MNDRDSQAVAAPIPSQAAPSTGGPLPTSALEAGVQVGDFRIERRLGAGGMGIVYQARQLSLNRPVALKVLGQALTRSADVSRFQREAQAAARLKHPSIAQVYFIGQDRHVCYLAMELIEGISLRQVLNRLETTVNSSFSLDAVVQDDLAQEAEAEVVRFDAPTDELSAGDRREQTPPADLNPYLSPQARDLRTPTTYIRRACELIRDAAQALAHAHAQGVVHRDIKPDNLLLDRHGVIHVIDFGVARFFEDQAVTYTGQLVGTPLYMSPEQVTGRGVIDARSDIYSIGLVLYELLAMHPPVEASNRENLLRTIVTKPLVPISWRNKAVPADLENIIHRATVKDPDQRYQSAQDLAAELTSFLTGKPVLAPPYHFRLDEREIVAARPLRIMVAAAIFFSVFSIASCLTIILMVVYVDLHSRDQTVGLQWTVLMCFAGLAAATAVPAPVLLSGRAFGRWLGIIVGAAMMLVSSFAFQDVYREYSAIPEDVPNAPFSTFFHLAFALAPFVLGIINIGILLSRPTAQWFRFARQIRQEHRQLREQVAG